MRKNVARTLSVLAGISLAVFLLLTATQMVAFNEEFYFGQYEKLGTADSIGISHEELQRVTRGVIDNIRGRLNSMQTSAKISGEMRPVFSQRELDHMVDVQALFALCDYVRIFSLAAFAVLMAAATFVSPEKRRVHTVGFGLALGPAALIAALGVLSAVIAADFYSAFNKFHHIFFTNDLWILNPETDVLLMMVPQPFFEAAALRIALTAAAFLVFVSVAGVATLIFLKRDSAKEEVAAVEAVQPPSDDWRIVPQEGAQDDGTRFHIERPEEERPSMEEILSRFGDEPLVEPEPSAEAAPQVEIPQFERVPQALEMLGWLEMLLDAAKNRRPLPPVPSEPLPIPAPEIDDDAVSDEEKRLLLTGLNGDKLNISEDDV